MALTGFSGGVWVEKCSSPSSPLTAAQLLPIIAPRGIAVEGGLGVYINVLMYCLPGWHWKVENMFLMG